MKKKLAATLSVVLILGLAVLGILAYLTDTDSDVNVMTLGNVKVELNELQRTEDGTALEAFKQDKSIMPIVGSGQENNEMGMPTGKNYVDKIVYATNTGKSDAYMRIIIAIPAWANTSTDESPSANNLHWNYPAEKSGKALQAAITEQYNTKFGENAYYGGTLSKPESIGENVEIDGQKYNLWAFTIDGAIAAGESTPVVLKGVYLDSDVDYNSETGNYIDANGNEFEVPNAKAYIPVAVQAIQTAGFDNAAAAFAASGLPVNPWAKTNFVESAADLRDALKTDGANVVLTGDIDVTKDVTTGYGQHMFLANGKSATIDLNGFDITVAEDATQVGSLFSTANGGNINIVGDGNVVIKNGKAFVAWSMNDTDCINVYGGNYSGNGHVGDNALFYVQAGKIDIYGGQYTYPVADDDNWGFNARDGLGNKLVIEIHEGALLQHKAFQYGDNSRIQLAEGCTLQEVTIDGATWYQVVK